MNNPTPSNQETQILHTRINQLKEQFKIFQKDFERYDLDGMSKSLERAMWLIDGNEELGIPSMRLQVQLMADMVSQMKTMLKFFRIMAGFIAFVILLFLPDMFEALANWADFFGGK